MGYFNNLFSFQFQRTRTNVQLLTIARDEVNTKKEALFVTNSCDADLTNRANSTTFACN